MHESDCWAALGIGLAIRGIVFAVERVCLALMDCAGGEARQRGCGQAQRPSCEQPGQEGTDVPFPPGLPGGQHRSGAPHRSVAVA
jgi:hypothetical protein